MFYSRGFFDDGFFYDGYGPSRAARSTWSDKSAAAQRREDEAKGIFHQFLESCKDGKTTFPAVANDLIPATLHLTEKSWKDFRKHVISLGCRAKRRVATREERAAMKSKCRKGKMHWISITVPVHPDKAADVSQARKKKAAEYRKRAAEQAEAKKKAELARKAEEEESAKILYEEIVEGKKRKRASSSSSAARKKSVKKERKHSAPIAVINVAETKHRIQLMRLQALYDEENMEIERAFAKKLEDFKRQISREREESMSQLHLRQCKAMDDEAAAHAERIKEIKNSYSNKV